MLLLGPYHFCPFWAHLCMTCSLGISNFLEVISSLSHSIVFLCFFAWFTEQGFLIFPCYSLELCIQMGISFLFSCAFWLLFFSQLFVRPPQTAILLFCISFSWGWSCSLSPVQCHKPLSIVHQALCLSDLVPYIYFSFLAQLCATLCNPMDCSPPGSSVQGAFEARILEWVAISFSIYMETKG